MKQLPIRSRVHARAAHVATLPQLPKDQRTRLAMRGARELAEAFEGTDLLELSKSVGALAARFDLDVDEGIGLASYAVNWREIVRAQPADLVERLSPTEPSDG